MWLKFISIYRRNLAYCFLVSHFLKKSLARIQIVVVHSVMSNSLWLHGLQHARIPCPSPSPGAVQLMSVMPSNHLILYPPPSSPACNISQHQGLFKWVGSSYQVANVLELQLQHQTFQLIFKVDFPYDWLVCSPYSPRDSQESSPTTQFKSINSLALSFFL